jgi:hypothetical protein
MSQNEMILKKMLQGFRISQKSAIDLFGCYRLSARIKNLKQQDIPIETELVKNKNNSYHAEYFLSKENIKLLKEKK